MAALSAETKGERMFQLIPSRINVVIDVSDRLRLLLAELLAFLKDTANNSDDQRIVDNEAHELQQAADDLSANLPPRS